MIHFLFSSANSFSVWVSAALMLIWFVTLGFYIREKLAAHRQAAGLHRMFGEYGRDPVKAEPFGANVVAKAEAHI